MRTLIYLCIGLFFGITLYKSEVASWYRIYEMFRFESFHMYGVIGVAVALGLISVQLIKRFNIKSIYGEKIVFHPKNKSVARYLFGGIIFGLGWALVGACPGPMFALIGAGFFPLLIVVISAILGTFLYGVLRHRLPH